MSDQPSRPSGPAVWVGPSTPDTLTRAVTAGGGDLVPDSGRAEAFVWVDGSPAELDQRLHERVRWLQLPSAGVERWIEAGVLEHGPDLVVTSAAGAFSRPVAEHALALTLAGLRGLGPLLRARTWTPVEELPAMGSLYGATVAVVGAGGIGRELIALLAPFGVRVLAVNSSGRAVEGAERTVAMADVAQVLPDADVVVLAAPATPQTHHLVDAAALAGMQQTGWLVNIARGSLVDTDALVAALRDGRIAGAALDVTDPEPLPDGHPLWQEPRALITPHSANPESLNVPALAEHVQENVRRWVAGEELLAVVSAEPGY